LKRVGEEKNTIMKKIKLTLNKEVITNLTPNDQINIKGGERTNGCTTGSTSGCTDGCGPFLTFWNCTDSYCTDDCLDTVDCSISFRIEYCQDIVRID
jgi:hypothetical protein